MPTRRTHVSRFPLFSGMRACCQRCRARYEIRVHCYGDCTTIRPVRGPVHHPPVDGIEPEHPIRAALVMISADAQGRRAER